ncbi:hypothetical protein ACI7BZ_12230 [Xanthobacter sp. AM11]|uniref:hypothetical protein n=1 Tax=Xanthobacter sp. AM11 TaxID=3380643 RepID=UPI0039BFA1AD
MSAPWMKFYPRDWRGDHALRAVSMAARGLWMECLCIMHEAKPYGHLLINGVAVEGDVLARMVGASADDVSVLMAELQKAGVLSVTRAGVVFSRRMVNDYGRAQKGSKAARKRWSQGAENSDENDRPNGYPNGTPITHMPEGRDNIREKSSAGSTGLEPRKPRKVGCLCPGDWMPKTTHFDLAKTLGRPPAWVSEQAELMRNWSHANAHEPKARKANWDAALSNWLRSTKENEDKRFGGRPPVVPFVPAEAPTSTDWTDHVRRFANGDTWPRVLGPAPGYSGCRVPPPVLAEFGFGASPGSGGEA